MDYQPRYSLAQAPGSELQNMNDQDVVYTSVGRKYQAVQQANVGAAISTTLSVTEATLTGSSATGRSVAAAAGAGIAKIFKLLWKQQQKQTQWTEFMDAVEYLVEQKIDNAIKGTAIARLEGIEIDLASYQKTADQWNNNPDDEAAKNRILDSFRDTERFIDREMPSFSIKGFEVTLLTVYTQAANLHLLLLQDAVNFGKGWGMSPIEIEDFYQKFLTKTVDYTDYCVNIYHAGLQKTKNLIGKQNPKDYNKYPYLNPYGGLVGEGHYYGQVLDWNVMNDYRRDMTLMVLDIVSIWPTYNPRQYTNPNGTKMELSREVYSTAYGKVGAEWENWEVIETTFVRPPHLVTWLKNLAFYIRTNYRSNNTKYYDQFNGIMNTLKYTESSNTFEDGFPPLSPPNERTTKNVPGASINGINVTLGYVPLKFDLYTASGRFSIGEVTTGASQRQLYNVSETIDSHRLCYANGIANDFSGYYGYRGLGSWGFGWLHNSLTPENTISADQITQIPAVKAYDIGDRDPGQVIKGPGSTGGDLVSLPPGGQGARLKMRLTPSVSNQNYIVRVRYASNSNGRLLAQKWIPSGSNRDSYVDVSATFSSGNLLTYNSFQYVNTLVERFNENGVEIIIQNKGTSTLIIDKIEFIPTGVVTEPPKPIEPPIQPPLENVGTFQIITALNNSSVLKEEIGYRVSLWTNYNGNDQKWDFLYNPQVDAYQLQCLNHTDQQRVLTWEQYLTGRDEAVCRRNYNDAEQYWIIEDAGDGYAYIRNKENTYRVLEVFRSNTSNGTEIIVDRFTGSMNQKFKLNKLS